MGQRKQLAINVVVGIVAQIISFVLSFASRYIFLRYLDVTLLGLGGTLSSVVSTLSLLDLGIFSVVVYRLYNPLINKRYEECNEILEVLRRFYLCVAGAITVLLISIAPFLKYFLKGIEITPFVYFVYIIISGNTIVSYFIAYKRTLLYADGKDAVAKMVDSTCNISFAIIRIVLLVMTSNFLLHQAVGIIQTLLSNLILNFYCKCHYKWLGKAKINKNILKGVFADAKNVFAGRIGGYVYGATDNLVISVFLKTVIVGFYSNYVMLSSSLRLLSGTVVAQIAPFIGKKYAADKSVALHEKIFARCSFVCFLMGGAFVVPLYLLADSFINRWLGASYVLPGIVIFLCLDLYIEIQQSAFCLYLGAAGLFAADRTIYTIGAVCNIVSSIIMVKIFGLQGVIMGTVLSQCVYWFLRGRCILKGLFKSGASYILKYLVVNLLYVLTMFFCVVILRGVLRFVYLKNFILQFVLQGVICELIFFVVAFVCFSWTEPFRAAVKLFFTRFVNHTPSAIKDIRRREKKEQRNIRRLYRGRPMGELPCKTAVVMFDGKTSAGGLCDRLRGIVSIYQSCKKMGVGFKLYFVSPFNLHDFMEPNTFDWDVSSDKIHRDRKSMPFFLFSAKDDVVSATKQRETVEAILTKNFRQFHFYTNAHYSLFSKSYSDDFNELFKPSDRIKKDLETYREGHKEYVSVSFRFMQLLGDFDERYKSIYVVLDEQKRKELINKSLKMLTDLYEKERTPIFVATDSKTMLNEASKLPFVFVVKGDIAHVDSTDNGSFDANKKTFIDFYMIANAKKVFLAHSEGMLYSGFPRNAALSAGKEFKIVEY